MSKKFLITSISVASGLFVLLAVLTALVFANGKAPFAVDTAIADWAYGVRGKQGGFYYWFFRIVTEMGYFYFAVALVVIMGIIWKFKSKTWFLAGTLGFAYVLHIIIKIIVERPRPDQTLWWAYESSSSFPSGHTNTATCMFVLLIFFIIISPYLKIWVKSLLTTLCCLAIVFVPLSRIILGVHYFSDVIGGVLLGGFCAVLGMIGYKLYCNIKGKKQLQEIPKKEAKPPKLPKGKIAVINLKDEKND